MSAAVIFSGYDMQKAAATGGTDYVKYTYATGQTQTYTLPEIPTYNYASYAMSRSLSDDPRETASPDTAVVNIGFNGTGFIIGDHEIMTAAHVVYGGTSFCSSMNLMINYSNPSDSAVNTVVHLTAISAHIPLDLINSRADHPNSGFYESDIAADYAIITVQEDLSEYGKFYLGAQTNSTLLNNSNIPVHVLGYYYYLEDVSYDSILKKSSGVVNSINSNVFTTSAYVTGGTSGGPIYVESSFGVPGTSDGVFQIKTYRTVIGIVSTQNCGSTRIDSETLQFAYDNNYL